MLNTPIWKHFAAFLYDIFPLIGLFLFTSLAVLLLRGGVVVERYSPWFIGLLLFEFIFYFVYSWKKGGQTIGMRAWKFKIVPTNSSQEFLTWKQAYSRFFIGLVSTVLLGLGLFWKLFSKDNRSWMDMVSDSGTKMLDV